MMADMSHTKLRGGKLTIKHDQTIFFLENLVIASADLITALIVAIFVKKGDQ